MSNILGSSATESQNEGETRQAIEIGRKRAKKPASSDCSVEKPKRRKVQDETPSGTLIIRIFTFFKFNKHLGLNKFLIFILLSLNLSKRLRPFSRVLLWHDTKA